jgi:NAD(P)H-flavin reductase
MPSIHFEGREIPVQVGETVLDCLLRNGIEISHSCKAGSCQSCLVKGSDGPIPEFAQKGLKDTLRAQGYFLACSCQLKADLTVARAGPEARVEAVISGVDRLNDTVLHVRLKPGVPLAYFAGQYVSLLREDGLARAYSLASLPDEQELALHVRIIPGGNMSEWLSHVTPGTKVWLQGPAGNCFYARGTADEPILLAGAGTGLAPLYGIVRDALRQGHTGEIWLFHGALTPSGLYLTHELSELARTHSNFHYVRSVRGNCDGGGNSSNDGGNNSSEIEVRELDQCILSRFPSLKGWKGYVCGDPALVNSLRKKLFLAGIASKAIYTDAFVPTAA